MKQVHQMVALHEVNNLIIEREDKLWVTSEMETTMQLKSIV